jgi:hypothetical protein
MDPMDKYFSYIKKMDPMDPMDPMDKYFSYIKKNGSNG